MSKFTWIKIKAGKVNRIMETSTDNSPGEGFVKVPNDWGGNVGYHENWFDKSNRRIPDEKLIESGIRKDNRGVWFHTETREQKVIDKLDVEPGDNFTREKPLENEPFQTWDGKHFIVDVEKKKTAEKEQAIGQKQAAIDDAERRIQRSTRAKLTGTATKEDERYFAEINAEINKLRAEKQKLLSA